MTNICFSCGNAVAAKGLCESCLQFWVARVVALRDLRNKEFRSRHISRQTRVAVFERDGGCCRHCGTEDDIVYDHVIPWSKGGGNEADNIQLLCVTCNYTKGSKLALAA